MSAVETSIAAPRPVVEVARDYLSLTKPRVVVLLVATALGTTVAAAHGWPHPLTALAVALGGALAAGGAHAVNCWFDRDIDATMSRTRRRPLPNGRIPAWHALLIGTVMNAAAFAVLASLANLLAALLALAGTLIYVLVYTVWLKRSTPQNIVIGGAAGAIPPLVGWAAVTGSLDLTAISLFLLVFFWTPPHFWALAQLTSADYSRARVPMMPVVVGDGGTKRRSLFYAVIVVVVSFIPFLTHAVGYVYLAGATVLGIAFVTLAVLDLHGRRWTGRLFHFSNSYLAALFLLLAIAPFTA
jgi:protoheme IX farnesyltransferase